MADKEFRIKDDLVVDNAPGRQLVVPSGPSSDRPGTYPGTAAPKLGTIRYNTVSEVLELYNGTTWQAASVAGEAVTFADATEISIVNAIVFG